MSHCRANRSIIPDRAEVRSVFIPNMALEQGIQLVFLAFFKGQVDDDESSSEYSSFIRKRFGDVVA
jgi:hypothetical protein